MVLVYLPINTAIDSGDVQVFGETVTTSDKIINLFATTLSAANLKAFMLYEENAANRDQSLVTVKTAASAEGLAVIDDLSGCVYDAAQCDVSGATWWGVVDTGNQPDQMYNYESLPELLLSQIAYDLFGHPLAKAGIANDKEILAKIRDDQKVANLFVDSIVAASAGNGLNVVFQQLLQQVPARFNVSDSSAGVVTPGEVVPLPVGMPFEAGDHIRFELTLNAYSITNWRTGAANDGGNVDPGLGAPSYNPGYTVSAAASAFSPVHGTGAKTYTVDIELVA